MTTEITGTERTIVVRQGEREFPYLRVLECGCRAQLFALGPQPALRFDRDETNCLGRKL